MSKRVKKPVGTVDVLRRMKSILRKGWTQGYYARTRTNRICEPDSRHAVKWCVTGARQLAEEQLDFSSRQARNALDRCTPGRLSVEAFNDAASTTKKDVIALIDCAIKKATKA